MKTVVEVPGKDRKGNPAKHLVQILSDTTISDDDSNPAGQGTRLQFFKGHARNH